MRRCHFSIGPGQTCPNSVHRSHKVPQKGETWTTATGEKAYACSMHHFRMPRDTLDRGVQVFRHDLTHMALFIAAMQTDPEVWAEWDGQQVLSPANPARTLRFRRDPLTLVSAASAQGDGDDGGVLLHQAGQGAIGMDLGELRPLEPAPTPPPAPNLVLHAHLWAESYEWAALGRSDENRNLKRRPGTDAGVEQMGGRSRRRICAFPRADPSKLRRDFAETR